MFISRKVAVRLGFYKLGNNWGVSVVEVNIMLSRMKRFESRIGRFIFILFSLKVLTLVPVLL